MIQQDENEYTRLQKMEIDDLNWKLAFQKKILAELKADENIQHYLSQFTPRSVEQFTDTYLYQKPLWHKHGELCLKLNEKEELKWIDAAWWHLKKIQQKKLFDKQCQWRAEQIQLPGVELCCDFGYWDTDVLNCPFLDPISSEEVDLYLLYLQSEDVELEEDVPMFVHWQYYSDIRTGFETENEDGWFPTWYAFYNDHKGTGIYLSLPDVRGEKEEFYRSLYFDRHQEEARALNKVKSEFRNLNAGHTTDIEGKPYLNGHDPEVMGAFVDAFEDRQTKEYYRAYAWNRRHQEEEERIQSQIQLLLAAGEPIAMEGHPDWREALNQTVRNYTIRKITEALPEAYEQYRMNVSMNISFSQQEQNGYHAARKSVVEQILTGREMNGEPRDLNF